MKRMHYIHKLSALLMFAMCLPVFVCCEKENNVQNPRLRREIIKFQNSTATKDYIWKQGKLKSIAIRVAIEGDGTMRTDYTFLYDGSRLLGVDYGLGVKYLFIYHNGKPDGILWIGETDTTIVTFTDYDNDNHITGLTTTNIQSKIQTKSFFVWQNGDPVKSITDTYKNGSLNRSDTAIYTYDNHPNIYCGIPFSQNTICGIYYPKHNRIDNDHSYFYDSDGRLVKTIGNTTHDTVYYQYIN